MAQEKQHVRFPIFEKEITPRVSQVFLAFRVPFFPTGASHRAMPTAKRRKSRMDLERLDLLKDAQTVSHSLSCPHS